MRGNLHVRFLGEEHAARRVPYPTSYEGSIPFTRSNIQSADVQSGPGLLEKSTPYEGRKSGEVRRLPVEAGASCG